MFTLEALILVTVFCGFFGIILKKNLMMKIISMDVMSTGVITFYVLVATSTGFMTPIALPERGVSVDSAIVDSAITDYADPVPQAVILTAIVIGFSIQALMLVGVMKLSRDNPTLECSEIERSNT
ncbi:MAG: cation:proton antiporter subunit C [Cyanobacteria bacterium P01_F01_bin.3]